MSRFQFVDDHRELFSIKRLCHVLQVSRSGYYRWRDGRAARAERRAADVALAEQIRAIHAAHDGTYGSPRVVAELRDAGRRVNHKRVERVMREHRIVGVHLRKVRTTVPDLAGRRREAAAGDRDTAGAAYGTRPITIATTTTGEA